MPKRQVHVLGNSLAALFCARRLSDEQNIHVIWTSSSPTIGGHFSGIRLGNQMADVGMVLLEIDSAPTRVLALDALIHPPTGPSVRPYLSDWFLWLHPDESAFQTIPVQTIFRGKVVPDFYIGDSLEIFSTLQPHEQKSIRNEVANCLQRASKTLHPRNKRDSSAIKMRSIEDYCQSTYGKTYTDLFIRPWMNSLGVEPRTLSAGNHRTVWLPLYWPETIYSALSDDQPQNFQKEFFVPSHSSVAGFVKDLASNLENRPNVDKLLTTDYSKTDPRIRQVWLTNGREHNDFLEQFKPIDTKPFISEPKHRIVISVVLGEVLSDSEDRVVFCLDADPVYRYSIRNTHRGDNSSTCSIEFTMDKEELQNFHMENFFRSFHEKTGITVGGNTKLIHGKIGLTSMTTPRTTENSNNLELIPDAFTWGIDEHEPIPDAYGSFNDQLSIGLWTAERILSEQ